AAGGSASLAGAGETVFTITATSASVIGTGGTLSGHGGACLAVLIASALATSICCLIAPLMSRISCSAAPSRAASLSRSSARLRTACANCRAAVSASNECSTGGGDCDLSDESKAANFLRGRVVAATEHRDAERGCG